MNANVSNKRLSEKGCKGILSPFAGAGIFRQASKQLFGSAFLAGTFGNTV